MIGHISQRATFARLSNEGTYVRSDALWCRFVVDPSLSIPHMGYAVGRQIGGAVVRNRLRRRLREIMKSHETDVSPGWYLIGVSQTGRTYRFAQLAGSANRLIRAIQTHSTAEPIQ
ncbi:MAG: ribonuclease P protein component [Ilumatobacteraceae bacterium]